MVFFGKIFFFLEKPVFFRAKNKTVIRRGPMQSSLYCSRPQVHYYKQFSCFELKQPYLLISTFTCGERFILLCSPMHLYIFLTFEDLKKKLFYRVISHNDLQCPSLPVSNCMKEIFLRLNVSVTQNVSSESSF